MCNAADFVMKERFEVSQDANILWLSNVDSCFNEIEIFGNDPRDDLLTFSPTYMELMEPQGRISM